jgi:two-component sensor histidine kinase
MQAAQASGRAAASGPVELVQEISPDKQIGFLIYLPVFSNEVDDPGPGQVAGGLAGFIYAPFRTGDLFETALNSDGHPPVLVQPKDVSGGQEHLIYQDADFNSALGSDLAVTETIDLAGRTWRLSLLPAPDYDTDQSGRLSIGIGSLLTALALAMGFLTQAAMQRHAEARKHQKTAEKDLFQKELILQEMKHRIKNSLGRVLAISRQTLKNSASLDDFHATFSLRLRAMASAQDMLTKSHWQRADLKELLMQELRQVFDVDDLKESISGSPFELNEAGAQAFGLVFHELATNALKYGAAEASDLNVSWRIERAGSGSELVVLWRETLPPDTPEPEKTGFGTALIDLNIRAELGGVVNRRFEGDGLRVELRVPMASVTV